MTDKTRPILRWAGQAAALVAGSVLAVSGCSYSSQNMAEVADTYRAAVDTFLNDMIANNIARARDHLPPSYAAIGDSSVVQTVEAGMSGSLPLTLLDGAAFSTLTLSPSANFHDQVTLNLSPTNTQIFQRNLTRVLAPDEVALIGRRGIALELAMLLFVQEIDILAIPRGEVHSASEIFNNASDFDSVQRRRAAANFLNRYRQYMLSYVNDGTDQRSWQRFVSLVEEMVRNRGLTAQPGMLRAGAEGKVPFAPASVWCFNSNMAANGNDVLRLGEPGEEVTLQIDDRHRCEYYNMIGEGGLFAIQQVDDRLVHIGSELHAADEELNPEEHNFVTGIRPVEADREVIYISVTPRSFEDATRYLGDILRGQAEGRDYLLLDPIGGQEHELLSVEFNCETPEIAEIDAGLGGGAICAGPWSGDVLQMMRAVYALLLDRQDLPDNTRVVIE
ncbi:MAG: hypothetical protein H6843_11315 [Rhodospirillaceae bacterium]|nr:hypothetical protein [Rhodospirillaceae bacterium]